MRWRVVWTERALKDADRLDPKVRQRIIAAIDRYDAAKLARPVSSLIGLDASLAARFQAWNLPWQA